MPTKGFTHPHLRAELLLLFLWDCAVSPSIWNHHAGCKSTELLRMFRAMGWSQLSCHNAPGAGLEAVTTLTRQQGWADRQNLQHLMTRDHGALAQYLCRVYSLQIPPAKSVWSELYFQQNTNFKKKQSNTSSDALYLTPEEHMPFPKIGMEAVPGSWSGSECIRFLSSWNRKEKRTAKTSHFK